MNNNESQLERAVVLLSGGLDSATVLAIAIEQGFTCHTLAIDYGQRHNSELKAADNLSQALGATSHKVVTMDLRAIGGSALTADIDVPDADVESNTIPITYVPARNSILLSLALGYAETINALNIFIGVNAVDYSGYPDCRPVFIDAFESLARVATKAGAEGQMCRIHTPLINLSKASIIQRGTALGVNYADTVSCYQADEQGRACGRCDSCLLRQQGFADAGVLDSTCYG